MKNQSMQIKSLLKVTLVFNLCVIMHRQAYSLLAMTKSSLIGGGYHAD
ncbi:hypothetical protein [Shewanella pealeana]|nr:hypothetical protein [Shewanella pealeana]